MRHLLNLSSDEMEAATMTGVQGTFSTAYSVINNLTGGKLESIRYVLACAGIEDYVLSDEHYGKKDLFVIDRKSGINTIAEVNSSWGIKNPFFFQKKVFYWGTKEEQKEIYVLEEGETILSLNKYGDLWEAETIAIPWIHHSQEVEVQHSKYSGIVTVEKTIVRSDDTGAVHMYIYFAGGEKDV